MSNSVKNEAGSVIKPKIEIQNMVAHGDLHATIDLHELAKHVKDVDYEPEQFPGAIYRVSDPKAAIILFKNGKMICTGAKSKADIEKVLKKVAEVVSKYVINEKPEKKAPEISEA
ncbi:MAG: hypothetical protein ACP5RP_00115 [Candidatus Micrarchaeia archaeon]